MINVLTKAATGFLVNPTYNGSVVGLMLDEPTEKIWEHNRLVQFDDARLKKGYGFYNLVFFGFLKSYCDQTSLRDYSTWIALGGLGLSHLALKALLIKSKIINSHDLKFKDFPAIKSSFFSISAIAISAVLLKDISLGYVAISSIASRITHIEFGGILAPASTAISTIFASAATSWISFLSLDEPRLMFLSFLNFANDPTTFKASSIALGVLAYFMSNYCFQDYCLSDREAKLVSGLLFLLPAVCQIGYWHFKQRHEVQRFQRENANFQALNQRQEQLRLQLQLLDQVEQELAQRHRAFEQEDRPRREQARQAYIERQQAIEQQRREEAQRAAVQARQEAQRAAEQQLQEAQLEIEGWQGIIPEQQQRQAVEWLDEALQDFLVGLEAVADNSSNYERLSREELIKRLQDAEKTASEATNSLEKVYEMDPYLRVSICGISKVFTENPVVDRNSPGHIYDEKTLREWVQKSRRSPLTNEPMTLKDVIPLPALRALVAYRIENINNDPAKELVKAAQLELAYFQDKVLRNFICPYTKKIIINPLFERFLNTIRERNSSSSQSTDRELPALKALLEDRKQQIEKAIQENGTKQIDTSEVVNFPEPKEELLEAAKTELSQLGLHLLSSFS